MKIFCINFSTLFEATDDNVADDDYDPADYDDYSEENIGYSSHRNNYPFTIKH